MKCTCENHSGLAVACSVHYGHEAKIPKPTLAQYKYDELPKHAQEEFIARANDKNARFVFIRATWYVTFAR